MSGVSKPTFAYLRKLGKNNNRPWFQENKPTYEIALADVKACVAVIEKKLSKIDEIEKVKIFRIYRDVRFSKDKTPYKTNFGVGFTRAGKERRGGFFVNISPGDSFIGGGFWGPNPADLLRIRKELEMDDKPMRKILKSANFKKHFDGLRGDEVKSSPKGFDKNHPNIDLIKKKQFLLGKDIKDGVVTDSGFSDEVVRTYKAMMPFFNYMSEVLTTDINGMPI